MTVSAGAGEDLLMGEELQVVLARLEGRVESLAQVIEVRLRTQERDVEVHRIDGDREHRELRRDLESTVQMVRELQEFRSKLIGLAAGLSLASGTVSGLLVALLTSS